MASPFSYFRRNQRLWLAILGVMAMVAFVFLDPRLQFGGSGGRQENPVVVNTNYGKFNRSEMMALTQSRVLVEQFLFQLGMAAMQQMGKDQGWTPQQIEMMQQRQFEAVRQVMQRSSPPGDQAAIETLVLAHRAEELGVVVSDDTINEFIKQITQNLVPVTQIEQIIRRLRGEGQGISEGYLFDALRRELLAAELSRMFQISLGGDPPAQRWNYFTQLNQRASCEVLPLPVSQFLKDVAEPTEEQVLALFEAHKNRLPEPGSPEPGFKVPAKAAFQYFKAAEDEFVERASESVTDKEIEEYYDKNKDVQFRVRDLPSANTEPTTGDPDKKDPDKKDEQSPASSEKSTEGAAQPETKPANPAQEKPDPTQGNSDPTQEKSPAQPPTKGAESKLPKQSATPPRGHSGPTAEQLRLVSDPPAGADVKAPPSAASDSPSAAEATKTADAPNDDKKPAEKADADAQADDIKSEEKPQYEPLDKVRGDIRKTLARQKANESIEEAFRRLTAKMREYTRARSQYNANKQINPDLPPPAALDVGALAAQEHVTAQKTDLITALMALEATDIGKSYKYVQDSRSQFGFRRARFVDFAFSPGQLYQPSTSQDDDNNHYLYWKTDEVPEHVPALDEVRSEVVRAWKLPRAYELAKKQAEKYVAEARKEKLSLRDFAAEHEGLKVTASGPFSQMTTGNLPFDVEQSAPHLSPVTGVDNAGPEFMRAVFRSQPGELKVAPNNPRSMVYIVEVLSFEPPLDELEHDFLIEDARKFQQVALIQKTQLYSDWIRTLEENAGVKWLAEPNVTHQRQEE